MSDAPVATSPRVDATVSPPLIAIALLSAAALAYEVLLARLFSIVLWHHFAYMIISVALLAEVAMVQPHELSEGERVRFLAERLPRCTIRVTGQPNPIAVLTELVRKIKAARTPAVPAVTQNDVPPRSENSLGFEYGT